MMERLQDTAGLVALGLVATAAGCGAFATELSNRLPLEPLPVYAEWWSATESCSGRAGDLDAISWYTATGITADGALASGLWRPPHDIILLLGRENDEFVVRHEMLHDLLEGDAGHESTLWATCDLFPG
jgi:hypothetical protein